MDLNLKKIKDTISNAQKNKQALRIVGGDTKNFFGNKAELPLLSTSKFEGIVDYEPSELVITAKAGTKIVQVEELLRQNNQILAFEPPIFGFESTLGGCIASGFSGPRRAYAGSARDFVLGIKMLNNVGEELQFGGQVMKNVAGYDVSRLMTGSFGTLGLILEVSLKVLPRPEHELTLTYELDEKDAINKINVWAGKALPLSGSCFIGRTLSVRLSGNTSAVNAAKQIMGGEINEDTTFWHKLRNQELEFFNKNSDLWRISLKSTTVPLELGPTLIEWNGALRWLYPNCTSDIIFEKAKKAGGHAMIFRSQIGNLTGQQQVAGGLLKLHQKLKRAMDPDNLFNPFRIHRSY